MGVDAEMIVRISGKENWLTDAEVRKLAYELSSSVGADKFFITQKGEFDWYPNGRHALEIQGPLKKRDAEDYERPDLIGKIVRFQDGDPIIGSDDEQFINVQLFGRYYGAGYERGDWPSIYATIEWLRINIPQGSIWYGGDSSGICMQEMTRQETDDLMRYWAKNGRRPYVHYRGGYGTGINLTCPHCDVEMADSGGSRDYTFLWCDGCNARATKHNDGRVCWAERHKGYPTPDENGEFVQREDPFK